MFASSYPFLDVVLSALVVTGFALWVVLFAHVLGDLFRSHDLTGAAKAAWIVVVLVFPVLGTLFYLLLRGSGTHERQLRIGEAQRRAFEEYIRTVAQTKE